MKAPSRRFITLDYNYTLQTTIKLEEVLPPDHLARFLADVIEKLDLSLFYAQYGLCGGKAYAPQILLALLLYGYITGVFSSRKIEKATYESLPFLFLAGRLHPDHDTIAAFRKRFLCELKEVFVQVLILAMEEGLLCLGDISQDGTKIHANASKSKAVSYKHCLKLQQQLQQEVEELLQLAKQADKNEQVELPEGMVVEDELTLRYTRLKSLAQAQAVIESRAEERYQSELDEYEAKMQARKEKEKETGKKTRGRRPKPPVPGARDKDQYNFTDPESRIMKNSKDKGFDQNYNAQVGVEHESRLVVANSLSNHPNDKKEAQPTLEALSPKLGKPDSASLDNGFFSAENVEYYKGKDIVPYIATGRQPHHKSWKEFFAQEPELPKEGASATVQMAYKLKTEVGKAIYRLRKSTVEPVIGIIKETMGFRQFSLRGQEAVSGEWSLVCLAYNLKRIHILLSGQKISGTLSSPTGC